ncbi:CYTOCHROME P450 FAMILY 1 [Salix koriyanagi]|uniref:CYTOCHROME P450 FAMILY 1 n=1 Tax=Salix koriyanagi TaxID=2511006 RepID=A0A9Q0UE83_9ROSI|nr:CYTOCHROME P450 FAMILY 1 [Salix koriyanagi]
MFSKDLLDPKSEKGAEFFQHAGKIMELAGKPNIADFLPILRWLDPQGIRRKTQFHVAKAFEIAGGFIKERTESMQNEISTDDERKDFLDVLLEFRGDGVEEPTRFSSTTINAIVLVSPLFVTASHFCPSSYTYVSLKTKYKYKPCYVSTSNF